MKHRTLPSLRAALVLALVLGSAKPALAAGPTAELPEAKRAAFLKLISRPLVPLAPELKPLGETNGLAFTHFSFAVEAGQRVPGLMVGKVGALVRRPVIVVLHGTGGNKEGMLPHLRRHAEAGFITVAIDARHHGERSKAGKGSTEYSDAILRAFREGREHPFFYDTVWDVMRLVDWLATRDDVDPRRIGLIGFSKGGIETYLAAAADPRIAAAVPCIGVQSFGWALDNHGWKSRVGTVKAAFDAAAKESGVAEPDAAFARKFYERVVPGVHDRFDGPAMLPLVAPRPLLVINGDSDERTPVPGVMLCIESARTAYKAAVASDRLVLRLQEKTGHKVNDDSLQAALEWFVKWLKP